MVQDPTIDAHKANSALDFVENPVYVPITNAWQRNKCNKFDLPLTRLHNLDKPRHDLVLRQHKPDYTHHVLADGNCLFRSMSWIIAGTQRHHRRMRLALIEHILHHAVSFSTILPGEGHARKRAELYLESSKMRDSGTWASDIEILAAAHLLNTAIYVFTKCGDSWQWVKHDLCLTAPRKKLYKGSIYLFHQGLCHYNVVEDIRYLRTDNTSQKQQRLNGISTCIRNPASKDIKEGCKSQVLRRKSSFIKAPDIKGCKCKKESRHHCTNGKKAMCRNQVFVKCKGISFKHQLTNKQCSYDRI